VGDWPHGGGHVDHSRVGDVDHLRGRSLSLGGGPFKGR
jgi:hypothetical protein